MLENVYFFTGENSYQLNLDLDRWILNFSQKFGDDALFVYHNENWDEGSVKQSVFSSGLFSAKKLIIIKGLPLGTDKVSGFKVAQVEAFIDEFLSRQGQISPDDLLVFVNEKPDKRSKLFKFLEKNAKVKQFDLPKESQLKQEIKGYIGSIKISDIALNKFIQKVGNDQYRIYGELDKLIAFCTEKQILEITEKMVDDLIFGLIETEVFKFLDLMYTDQKEAIEYLYKIQYQGLDRNALSGALYWGLRIHITIYHFTKRGIKDAKTIANQTGINVYSLFQPIKSVEFILKNGKKIENMYKKLLDIDFDIKSGKTEERFFWLEIKKHINSFKF